MQSFRQMRTGSGFLWVILSKEKILLSKKNSTFEKKIKL
jgi:hypothetical protein